MMKQTSQSNKIIWTSSGFTLIEILLVLLITSILVLGINAAYRQAHLFWSRITETQPAYAQSRVFLDTLRQELTYVYLAQPQQTEEGEEPPALFTVKSGKEMSFLTLNPAWNTNLTISMPTKVTYTFTKGDNNDGVIIRSEQPYSGEKPIGTETQKQTILMGLDNLEIQALERNSDDDSWKSDLESKEKTPQAIKIKLTWPEGTNSDEVDFEMLAPILSSGVPINTNEQ